MAPIKQVGSGTPHVRGELPVAKKAKLERGHDPVVDQIERRRPGNRLDPHEMRRHIDKVLDGPWGPIDARALYSAPIRDKPDIPRDVTPGWPGDVRALYAVDINPDPIRPRPPEIQPMYGVSIDPKPPRPPEIQPMYGVNIDPLPIREPPIRAMYGIDIGDIQPWPRKA